jgi:hypothetical protein
VGGQETVGELCAKLRRMFQLLQNVQLVDMNQWVIEVSKESTRGKKKQCSLLDAGLSFFHQAYLQVLAALEFASEV